MDWVQSKGGDLLLLPGHRMICPNVSYPYYEFTYGIINTKPADTSSTQFW